MTGQCEHVCANPKMRVGGSPYVDFKLQPVLLDKEVNCAPTGEKTRCFSDGKHACSLHGLENSLVTLGLGPAHEKNLASAQILFFTSPAHFDTPAVN